MTPEPNWTVVDSLLDRALDLPPEQRATFIREAAGDDAALHDRLEQLLRATSEGFTEAAQGLSRAVASQIRPGHPTTVGPYRLFETLGHGGMGAVYRAERDVDGATQVVALKMIRPELLPLASPETVRRFEQERAMLSRLNHPHIARFIDAGETPEGTPYLVMEFVRGTRITDFCAEADLSLPQRIQLIQSIAHAVAFAHRQLVIHRDLKPSNLLVSQTDDGTIVPKVIDFGIAKLLTTDATDDDLPLTAPGLRVLTPEYAAPEQLLDGDVGTAADIYALGVVLYEVVTGYRPFQADSREALERMVRQDTPTRPSQRVRDSTRRATAVQRLPSDLDWICLKALHKDPEQRYRSATELAEDLENVLHHRPVRARRPTLRYRTARFARRNKTILAAAAAVLITLIGGLGASLWQARIASSERDRATAEAQRSEQASAFLADLLTLGDPYDTPSSIPVSALADTGLVRLQRATEMDPLLRADVALQLASVFQGQGRSSMKEAATQLAIDLLDAANAMPDLRANAHIDHAEALLMLGQLEASVTAARRGVEYAARTPDDHILGSRAATQLGLSLIQQGQKDEAERALRTAIAELDEIGIPDSLQMMYLLDVHSGALDAIGRIDESLTVGARALAISRDVLGSESAAAQIAPHNYALSLISAARYAEAEALLVEVIRREGATLGENHPSRAISAINLADIELQTGRIQEAATRAAAASEVLEAATGDGGAFATQGRIVQAVALARLGRQLEAEALFKRQLTLDASVLPPADRAEVEFLYGTTLLQAGRAGEGEVYRQRALPLLSPTQRVSLERMAGTTHD